MLQNKRKLDPNRFKDVKSKVSKNIRVINKNQIKSKIEKLKKDEGNDNFKNKINFGNPSIVRNNEN